MTASATSAGSSTTPTTWSGSASTPSGSARSTGAAQADVAGRAADHRRRARKRRTPRLAATYAAEFNVGFSSAEVVGSQFDRAREACDTIGRDPGTLVYSTALTVCCGRDDSEVRRRAEAIGRDVAELRADGIVGTPAEVVETIGRYARVGTERVYLQVLDLADLDHLDLLAAEVLPVIVGTS